MMKTGFILLIALSITLVGCQGESTEVVDVNDSIENNSVYEPDQRAVGIDQYMSSVDTNPEFATFSSLTYNSDDESHRLYEVQMLKKPNDSSYAKLVELSSSEFSGSLQSNSFYFKNNPQSGIKIRPAAPRAAAD